MTANKSAESHQLTVRCRVAWWVRPYIGLLSVLSRATGWKPDLEKATDFAMKGCKVRVEPK